MEGSVGLCVSKLDEYCVCENLVQKYKFPMRFIPVEANFYENLATASTVPNRKGCTPVLAALYGC